MARLSVFLLGPFHATIAGQAIIAFKYDKVRALLTYLAVESHRPHRRDYLAGLFYISRDSVQFNNQSDHYLDISHMDFPTPSCQEIVIKPLF